LYWTFCLRCIFVLFAVCTSVRIRPVKRYIPNTSSANFTNIEWGECAAKCFDRDACLSFTYRRWKFSFEEIFRLECDLFDSIENASTVASTNSRQIWFGDKICSTGTSYSLICLWWRWFNVKQSVCEQLV